MKGYVNIPKTIYVKLCKACGSRPIISMAGEDGYIIKCPSDNNHYQTPAGLIDLENWNSHNKTSTSNDYNIGGMQPSHS
jgi:hypothetical protein